MVGSNENLCKQPKPFARGLQVMKTILKWLTSGLQVVQKLLASGLLASKPMQALQTLVI